MIRTLVLFITIYLALLAQEFIPPAPFLDGARLLLVPALFCYGALWLSFPGVLMLALYTGLLSDLSLLQVDGNQVEIGLGWTMLFYVFIGSVLHILRQTFPTLRWEIHSLASGSITLLLLLAQYLMVCLRRESFFVDGTVFWQIMGPALMALFIAIPIYFFLKLFPGGFAWRRSRDELTS